MLNIHVWISNEDTPKCKKNIIFPPWDWFFSVTIPSLPSPPLLCPAPLIFSLPLQQRGKLQRQFVTLVTLHGLLSNWATSLSKSPSFCLCLSISLPPFPPHSLSDQGQSDLRRLLSAGAPNKSTHHRISPGGPRLQSWYFFAELTLATACVNAIEQQPGLAWYHCSYVWDETKNNDTKAREMLASM